jgi:hypothetical protein
MPLQFLLDENLRGPLWRAIQRHNAMGSYALDVIRVGDAPDLPLSTLDPAILLWAEKELRILVSFDKKTMIDHLANHLQSGHHCPGIFAIRRRTTVPEVLSFVVLAAYASEPHEWQDRIEFIG